LNDDAVIGLAGVVIWTSARRFAAMARFYANTLGLDVRTERGGFVNFELGDQRLTVTTHDEVTGAARDPLRIMLNLEVSNIAAVHARLVASGVAFLRPPEREPWGGWVATFVDPDGNTLQLFELPPEPPRPPSASTSTSTGRDDHAATPDDAALAPIEPEAASLSGERAVRPPAPPG
jgi:predicted enzyme related to lactoylglutathione lyase